MHFWRSSKCSCYTVSAGSKKAKDLNLKYESKPTYVMIDEDVEHNRIKRIETSHVKNSLGDVEFKYEN